MLIRAQTHIVKASPHCLHRWLPVHHSPTASHLVPHTDKAKAVGMTPTPSVRLPDGGVEARFV